MYNTDIIKAIKGTIKQLLRDHTYISCYGGRLIAFNLRSRNHGLTLQTRTIIGDNQQDAVQWVYAMGNVQLTLTVPVATIDALQHFETG